MKIRGMNKEETGMKTDIQIAQEAEMEPHRERWQSRCRNRQRMNWNCTESTKQSLRDELIGTESQDRRGRKAGA